MFSQPKKDNELSNKFYVCAFLSQNEIGNLKSQSRISKLASDDLQAKLTQAYEEREELARRLQQAEEALREKVVANTVWHNKHYV